MNSLIRNPCSGFQSAGYRFRFQVRAISHNSLYLPLEMKTLPAVQALLKGTSPLEVFNTPDLKLARKAFVELRKQYDFPFWAATEYRVRNIDNCREFVTLRLNRHQHRIADTFLRRYHDRKEGHYVIGKSFGQCGLTTCVQAYITWRQLFSYQEDSHTCVESDCTFHSLKATLCRLVNHQISPYDEWIDLPNKKCNRVYFDTYHTPEALRGKLFGYVHFANMSLWEDPDGYKTRRAFETLNRHIFFSHRTLLVMEGDVPSTPILRSFNPEIPIQDLTPISNNPYFLKEVLLSIKNGPRAQFHFINLDR